MKHLFSRAALGLLAMVAAGSALAQWQPSGPVELIVAAGPGGGNDRTARMLAKFLSETKLVSVPLVVVNKPGAGGVIAQNYLNTHHGSGNYLMITYPALITNPLTGMGSASYTDITPVAQLFTESIVMLAREGLDIKTGKDVIEAWKRDPGSLSIAVTPGLGAGPHVAAALVAHAVGVDPKQLRPVPFVSAGESATALLGGHVDLLLSTPQSVIPPLSTGKVRAIGSTGAQRLGGVLATVPTWREQGVDVVFGNWRGIVGPTGMTREQLAYWDQVFAKLVATDAWKTELKDQLAENDYMNSADSKAFLDQENQRLGKILAQLGLTKNPEAKNP